MQRERCNTRLAAVRGDFNALVAGVRHKTLMERHFAVSGEYLYAGSVEQNSQAQIAAT
jgi:hypothetical protein